MSEPYDPNVRSNWDARPAGTGYAGPPPVGVTPPYPEQSYPTAGYPTPGYPAPAPGHPGYGYNYAPPGYPNGPYAPPGYLIYPLPGRRNAGRPGQVIGAAVLSYVEAGLLILTGLILFSGSSAVSSWSSDSQSNDYGWGTQFLLAGFADLAAAALLIGGAVAFSGGRRRGRTLMSTGLGVCVAEAIFWIARLSDNSGAIIPWAAFFLVMPIIATALSYSGDVSTWLKAVASPQQG